MLNVRQNGDRMVIELGGVWSFKLDQKTSAAQAPIPGLSRDGEPAAAFTSYNDQKGVMEYRDHYGWAYYQRTLTVPTSLKGQRLWLQFGAAARSVMVRLGDTLFYTHKGGSLPFEAEITDLAEPGDGLLLTAAMDNQLSHSTLPVGNDPTETAFFGSDSAGIPSVKQAKREQRLQDRPNFDFFNYAGIFGPVYLHITPRQFVKDITLVLDLERNVEHEIETEGQGDVEAQVLDREGNVATRSQGSRGTTTTRELCLWEPQPGTPYLYTARVTLTREGGADVYGQPFDPRTAEVKGKRFLLNGKPFYFKGFGEHEDLFFRGRGLDLCLSVKNVNLVCWLGVNSFHTNHCPYAGEVYDLCGRKGIVIVDEITAVGLNMGGNGNPHTCGTREHYKQVIEDLIKRDKSHPRVVMQSLESEPGLEHYPQETYDYWHPLYELIHREDPQDRPVTLVCCQNDYAKDITTRAIDVVCLNRYYGWYNLGGDLDAACNGWNMELGFWAAQEKPVIPTKYGANTMTGIHQAVPGMFSEKYQGQYYERINCENDKHPFFMGGQIWNFADSVTIQGPMRVDGGRKGILTRERTPKLAAHNLRHRWNGTPDFGYK